LVAISNSKCIGWKLYEKGGITKERFVDFMKNKIFNKYKNHLIILDNAVEGLFNQLKYYLKLNKKVLKFNEIKKEIKNAFTKIKKDNYKNYFLYAYDKKQLKLPTGKSTLRRKHKTYKD
jgi:hypothetical protein